MRRRDQADEIAEAMRQSEGTDPVAVIVLLTVPPSFKGLTEKELVRKMSHPVNTRLLVEQSAAAIAQYFNDPVSAENLYQNLTTAAKRAAEGEA